MQSSHVYEPVQENVAVDEDKGRKLMIACLDFTAVFMSVVCRCYEAVKEKLDIRYEPRAELEDWVVIDLEPEIKSRDKELSTTGQGPQELHMN